MVKDFPEAFFVATFEDISRIRVYYTKLANRPMLIATTLGRTS